MMEAIYSVFEAIMEFKLIRDFAHGICGSRGWKKYYDSDDKPNNSGVE